MTTDDAAKLLRDMYDNAPRGGKATATHLFGIRHAHEIDPTSLREPVRQAGWKPSYHTELRKMINLAEHVTLKQDQVR